MLKINLNDLQKAYIAGFLDGDGSILTQIVKDNTRKFKFYIRVSIVFYQKTDHYWFLLKLADWLKPYGFIRKRGVMSEYVIVAKKPVKTILTLLYPHLILKRPLCKLVLSILDDLEQVKSEADFLKVCNKVDETAKLTYSKTRFIDSGFVENILFSPVETSENN